MQVTKSVQRTIPVIQIHTPNYQYLSPVTNKQHYATSTAPKPQETPQKSNDVNDQLESLHLNLMKENQTLKDKLSHLSSQVNEAEKKLKQYKI